MARTKTYCGLDIGNSSIKALVLRWDKRSDYEEILGFARLPTKGFSKGAICDLGLFCDTIEAVLENTQKVSRARIDSVFVNISGTHIKSYETNASIRISDSPSEITQHQILRVIELAKALNMPVDREEIYIAPLYFLIDEQFEIADPSGLYATKLDVVLKIVTGTTALVQNITKSLNMAGYEVRDMVLSGIAQAESIVTQEEKKEGAVVIIDIGSQMTDLTLYINGRLKDFFVLPFGGDDLTQAIADELNISFNLGEDIKIRYGLVTDNNSPGPLHAQLELSLMGGSWVELNSEESDRARQKNLETRKVTRSDISFILLPKIKELFEQIKKAALAGLINKKVPPRVLITGGGALLDGLIETAQEVLEVPVELRGVQGDLVTKSKMQGLDFIFYVTSLGLARFGAKSEFYSKGLIEAPKGLFGKVFSRLKDIYDEYF